MLSDLTRLDGVSRLELIEMARRLGAHRPEVLTREELTTKIVELSEMKPERRAPVPSGGFFDSARRLIAGMVEQGLNLPDAAARIRGAESTKKLSYQSPIPTTTLAKIYVAQGHEQRAIKTLKEVLALKADDLEAQEILASLQSSRLEREHASKDLSSPTTQKSTFESSTQKTATAEQPSKSTQQSASASAQPVLAQPVATPLVATPLVATPPVATPPVATPPVATPPVATPPVAIPPVATPPVATPPVATLQASPSSTIALALDVPPPTVDEHSVDVERHINADASLPKESRSERVEPKLKPIAAAEPSGIDTSLAENRAPLAASILSEPCPNLEEEPEVEIRLLPELSIEWGELGSKISWANLSAVSHIELRIFPRVMDERGVRVQSFKIDSNSGDELLLWERLELAPSSEEERPYIVAAAGNWAADAGKKCSESSGTFLPSVLARSF